MLHKHFYKRPQGATPCRRRGAENVLSLSPQHHHFNGSTWIQKLRHASHMALEIDRFVFVDTRGESGRIGRHNRANSRKACQMGTAGHPKAYTRNAGPPLSGQMEGRGKGIGSDSPTCIPPVRLDLQPISASRRTLAPLYTTLGC